MERQISSEDGVTLPWDKFGNWVHCICVVTFDLELGQAIELVYPKHVKLSDAEKMNISYLAFPDSNSGCMGDTQYHFRIRMTSTKRSFSSRYEEFNANCPSQLQPTPGFAFGYVYFRQVRDKTIRRGYFQKSVVIISGFSFVPFFTHLASTIAPEFFTYGPPSLEAACHDIDQWPSPQCGATHNLPLMGTVLQVKIPSKADKLMAPIDSPAKMQVNSSNIQCLFSVYELNLYSAFKCILPNLQLIWELVLTAQPLLVMGPSPSACSELVQSLVSTIFPIRYDTDYRPFFTIHDSEFKEFTTKTQAPPQVILGVTNPFFTKALAHWPNIIRVNDPSGSQKESKKVKKTSALFKSDDQAKPGIYTRYKPYLVRDQTFYKKIKKGIQGGRPDEIQTLLIRRFCLELTQSFMIPLERYVASLMPLQKTISPFKGVPCLGRFNMDDFLKSVDHCGPQLTCGIKGDWIALYKKFISCPNFASWLSQRQHEINSKLQQLHLDALCTAQIEEWILGKQEVELVDMIIHLNDKFSMSRKRELIVSLDQAGRLRHQINTILSALPEDLRGVVQLSSTGSGASVSVQA